jgi:hypothetical protein
MIAVNSSGIIPAAEKRRKASMIGIPWNAWFLEVRLYHRMPLRNKLKDDNVSRIGGDVVRVE